MMHVLSAVVTATYVASRGAFVPCGAPSTAATSPRLGILSMAEETLKCDVRKLPKSAIALDIKVPKGVANDIHLKTLARLAKSAKIDGFREGKVPPQAVAAKLGKQKVNEATVEAIIDVGMQKSGVGQRIQTVGEARLPEELENLAKRYKVRIPPCNTVAVTPGE